MPSGSLAESLKALSREAEQAAILRVQIAALRAENKKLRAQLERSERCRSRSESSHAGALI